MPRTQSILRYPGGKTQLAKFVRHTIEMNHIEQPVYCEAFCGGSGIAIENLLNGSAHSVILNDLDPAIYSIWYAAVNCSERLINRIQNISITITEWHRQKDIYSKLKEIPGYNFDLAVAAFFLNRTNRAGIITGGPIGGYAQQSKYNLSCRFNKSSLINKIRDIAKRQQDIQLYNMDGIDFIHNVLWPMENRNLFILFDPPYVHQGQALYKNGLNIDYHSNLSHTIQELHNKFWITTYDDVPEIRNFYRESPGYTYQLHYSAHRVRKESELFFRSPITKVESFDKVQLNPI